VLYLLISGATIVDGSGAQGYPGSVGVEGDRIVWVGHAGAEGPDAGWSVNADGLGVVRVFIRLVQEAMRQGRAQIKPAVARL